MATNREDVEFKTMDGTTLHGWLYAADEKGPGIVMTPGVCSIQTLIYILN
jgi:hypothetical protein